MHGRSMRHTIGLWSQYVAYDIGLSWQCEAYDRCMVAV